MRYAQSMATTYRALRDRKNRITPLGYACNQIVASGVRSTAKRYFQMLLGPSQLL